MTRKPYIGHRQRMRKKILDGNGSGLLDYELLETLLFNSFSRCDTKTLAKNILNHCDNNLLNVLNSPPDHLRQIHGLGDTSISIILCVRTILNRILATKMESKPVLNSWSATIDYLRTLSYGSTTESLRVLYLNQKHTVIDDIVHGGTVNKVSIHDREIIKHALYKGAVSIIISHNHLGNDASPSRQDVSATKKLSNSCEVLGIQLLDHIIIAGDQYFSFREKNIL